MKRYIYFFIFFILIFSFSLASVDAATLTRGAYNKKYDTFIPKKIDGTIAYCANHSYWIPDTGSKYYKNPNWDDSNVCEYKTNKNVDCSIMVGYIISVGRSLATKNNLDSASKFVLVQSAIQSYLYKYSGGKWDGGNKNFLGDKFGSVKVSTVISEAWKKYKTYQDELKNARFDASVANNMNISISVDGNDNKLYYNPSEGNEAYYSYKITVNVSGVAEKNYEKLIIDLSTSGKNEEVRFCDNYNGKWSSCAKTVSIPKVNKKSFYLISKKPDNFNVNAKVTYTDIEDRDIKISYKDSIMYDYVHTLYNGHKPQKFVILDSNTKIVKKPVKKVSVTANKSFEVVPIKKGNCSNLYSGYNDGSSSSKSVICENNKKRGEAGSTSASFASCIENKVSISYSYYYKKNKCQNASADTKIVVGQKGYFNFGKLIGDTDPIIKGQGFYLDNTYYVNQVSWKNSLMYSNGNVYYWLPNNKSIHHNTYVYPGNDCKGNKIKFDVYANQISSYKIASDIENGDNGLKNKTFKTYNNNSNSESFVPVNINKTGSVANSVRANTVQRIQYVFKAPNAYIRVKDNNVYYNIDGESKNNFLNDNKYVSGGQRYYTLLKYSDDTFPFNLDVSNLSTVKGVTWKLNGICDVDLDDSHNLYDCTEKKGVISCQNNYTYRTISVNNPFPKAVASNWDEYYKSSKNMARLKSTFANGESGRYYSVSLTRDKINKIIGINESDTYTTFENINSEGISSVINDANGFTIFANGDSFCKLGEFNASCDKLK